MSFICLYMGANECVECGGGLGREAISTVNGRFCDGDCADSFAAYMSRVEEADRQRRQAEDDFGREVERLSAAGYSYEEIDTILEDMP